MAKSEATIAAITDSSLTLNEALILAEFDGDETALATLHRVIEDGDTAEPPYYAGRLRQYAARRVAVAVLTV